MKYVSIDIETTGLNPETDQMLELAAITAETSEYDLKFEAKAYPGFMARVKHDRLSGDPFALQMNAELIRSIEEDFRNPCDNSRGQIMTPGRLAKEFAIWLREQFPPEEGHSKVRVSVAGKNFSGFDKLFIQRLPGWNTNDRPFIDLQHRVLDPAILWFDPEHDSQLPNLDDCKARAGVKGAVTHRAADDALDVIRCIEAYWRRMADTTQRPSIFTVAKYPCIRHVCGKEYSFQDQFGEHLLTCNRDVGHRGLCH